TCTLTVNLSPTSVGTKTASFLVNHASGGGSAPLSGTATARITVTPGGDGSGTITSNPSGINCGTTCIQDFSAASVVLTAMPAANSNFDGWSGACSGAGTCTLTVNAAKSVGATFTKKKVLLTVQKMGMGTGMVTSVPTGIDCGAQCMSQVGYGDPVVLTPMPDPNMAFVGWSGGGCSGTGTCMVSPTVATTVTATFQDTFTLSVDVDSRGAASGTVSSSPPGIQCSVGHCTAVFPRGTLLSLTATPGASSAFTGWRGTSFCVS